jgi:hypothetical protein
VIEEVRQLVHGYADWLRDKSVLREIGSDYVEITTPFLNRHNDYTQIYVQRLNGSFLITDGGETIEDLRMCGCDIETKKRKDLLFTTLNGLGIHRNGDALYVKATKENFSLRKHNLIQALLAVNDLFYLAAPVVANLFLEDVAAWLQLHEIRHTPNVKLSGKSGFDHNFDFVIPSYRDAPERLIKTMNNPKRDFSELIAFSWVDTKEVRPLNSRLYVFLNDIEKPPAESSLDALRNYDIRPISWSQREGIISELAA